jgi:hypothetical protein
MRVLITLLALAMFATALAGCRASGEIQGNDQATVAPAR